MGDPPSLRPEEVRGHLARSAFLTWAEPDLIDRVAGTVTARRFAPGDALVDFDSRPGAFTVLAEGAVDGFTRDAHGTPVRVGQLAAGDHFGDFGLIADDPPPMRLVAVTDGVALEVPPDVFRGLVEAHPRLGVNLYRAMGHRFRSYANAVRRPIPSPVLGATGVGGRAAEVVRALVAALRGAGEPVTVWSPHPERLPGLAARPLDAASEEAFRRARDRRTSVRERHVIACHADRWADVEPGPLARAGEQLWLVEPDRRDEAFAAWSRAAEGDQNAVGRTRAVWLPAPGAAVAPYDPRWPAARRPVVLRVGRPDLGRLVRAVRGYALGLALGGGAAWGMAHLGVLKALDDAGIGFDLMAGTSSGAMTGVLYAAGVRPADLAAHFARDLTPSRWWGLLPEGKKWYLLAQFRRGAWDGMLRRYLGDWVLEQLAVPMHAVTVDLVTGAEVVRDRGDAVQAVLESINLPGISRPIVRGGMALVDGGVLNNLPADVLADRGADFVAAVSVSGTLRPEFAGMAPGGPPPRRRPTSLDTLFRLYATQAHFLASVHQRAVHFALAPDVSGFSFTDFTKAREIAAVGEAAAREAVPALRARLAEFEAALL